VNASATETKACCAQAYASGAARFLLGDDLHPGGAALTDELLRALRVGPAGVIVDVASGPGTSARRAAAGCMVIAVDISAHGGWSPAPQAGGGRVQRAPRFLRGDAEALPLGDASVDGALCECAFCLFPDKRAAAREIGRVLRPGARVALSDVCADAARLPLELRSLDAYVACLAGAVPLARTAEILEDAGLTVERLERRDEVVAPMLERIQARLRFARLIGGGQLAGLVDRAEQLARAAQAALREGALGYGIVIARR
jgi:arsenite methyltransferase